MPRPKQRRRARTHSKTIGRKPFSGCRYVLEGQVRIEWRTRDGKRCQRTVGPNTRANRDLADEILARALTEVRDRAHGLIEDPALSLQDLLARHRAGAEVRRNRRSGKRLATKTLATYEAHERTLLAILDPGMPAIELRKGDVARLIEALRKRDWAERSVYETVAYLQRCYQWAVLERELLTRNPIEGARNASRVSRPDGYSPEEVERLMDRLDRVSERAWRFRGVVYIAAVYGVRIQQALHLRRADVDFGRPMMLKGPDGQVDFEGTITFRSDAPGSKDQPDRTLPLVPLAKDALWLAHKRRREGSPWVFWNWRDDTKPVRYDAMNEQLKKLEGTAGVEHVKGRSFHAFRRALTTALIEEVGLDAASAWVGDRPEVLLRAYLRPNQRQTARAAAAITRIFGCPTPAERLPHEEAPQGRAVSDRPNETLLTGPAGLEPATAGFGDRCSAT